MGQPNYTLSLAEDQSKTGFRNVLLHLKLDDGRSPRKEDYVNECRNA